ncbi:MAG: hypothetical protein HY700_19275 [Gemmatimonadetes bacterium]|nr:hypothetical protein [Gemmatimonadota bacterium]
MPTLALVLLFLISIPASAQVKVEPTNDLPDPYLTMEGWARMPQGRTWGSTSAVEIDRDGVSVWVAERCGANNCLNSNLDPILKFDSTGKFVKSFGSGLMISPHGIYVDQNDNVWVTDCTCTLGRRPDTSGAAAPAAPTKGHQVFKFSPDGKLLLTLGKAGVAGDGPDVFNQPSDVIVAPNGDIFVADGHNTGTNNRIVKFDRSGKLITMWGKLGSGPGELNVPHAIAMDASGRLFVGDRSNNRIQIFDQDGKFIGAWSNFSRPSGIYIRGDDIYVADSESGSVAKDRPEWQRGIRIGRIADHIVRAFIPDPNKNATGTSAAEGVAVDAHGVIYGAEVGPRALKRYVRQ